MAEGRGWWCGGNRGGDKTYLYIIIIIYIGTWFIYHLPPGPTACVYRVFTAGQRYALAQRHRLLHTEESKNKKNDDDNNNNSLLTNWSSFLEFCSRSAPTVQRVLTRNSALLSASPGVRLFRISRPKRIASNVLTYFFCYNRNTYIPYSDVIVLKNCLLTKKYYITRKI